jgi:hypothetical protein
VPMKKYVAHFLDANNHSQSLRSLCESRRTIERRPSELARSFIHSFIDRFIDCWALYWPRYVKGLILSPLIWAWPMD